MKTGLPSRYRSLVKWAIGQQKNLVGKGVPRATKKNPVNSNFPLSLENKKNLIFHDLEARQIENGNWLYLNLDCEDRAG